MLSTAARPEQLALRWGGLLQRVGGLPRSALREGGCRARRAPRAVSGCGGGVACLRPNPLGPRAGGLARPFGQHCPGPHGSLLPPPLCARLCTAGCCQLGSAGHREGRAGSAAACTF